MLHRRYCCFTDLRGSFQCVLTFIVSLVVGGHLCVLTIVVSLVVGVRFVVC